jgi:glycine/D-amino acid oxidase-like deaminating enzyme
MQCASLLREAMWSMVSELHLDAPGVDYVAYTAREPRSPRRAARRLQNKPTGNLIMTLPSHAQIVVIGGGIIGCSTAYHLARDHKADVILLEQGKLTSGSTWHAAGLVGQLRSSASITRVLKYSVDLYKELEAETGLATGWKMTGCLRLATNQDRWTEYKRLATTAKSFGMDMQLVSPDEVKRMWPLLETGDLVGASWLPTDGQASPLRHHPVARQRRAHARREAVRGGARHRLRDEGQAHHGREDHAGRHRLRQRSSTAPGNGRGRWARWPASPCRSSR